MSDHIQSLSEWAHRNAVERNERIADAIVAEMSPPLPRSRSWAASYRCLVDRCQDDDSGLIVMSTPTVKELHPPLQATEHDTFADDLEPRRGTVGFQTGTYVQADFGRKRSIAGAS